MATRTAKFTRGAYVTFKHTAFSPQVYWTVIVAAPDTEGRIVVVNRDGEYSLPYQADMKGV